jgi:hypothetical protein
MTEGKMTAKEYRLRKQIIAWLAMMAIVAMPLLAIGQQI